MSTWERVWFGSSTPYLGTWTFGLKSCYTSANAVPPPGGEVRPQTHGVDGSPLLGDPRAPFKELSGLIEGRFRVGIR